MAPPGPPAVPGRGPAAWALPGSSPPREPGAVRLRQPRAGRDGTPDRTRGPEARGAAGSEAPVVTFREIWNRSFCRPLEQLVDVITEFPNEVEYIFRPSCVSLQRCGGCCGDEGLRCVPVETSTVTMQLLKIKPSGEAPYVEMAFTEHKRCECRPRQDLMKSGRRRSKGRDAAHHAGSLRCARGPAAAVGV
ncbi:placenta growth factor-like isoform X2 [Apteryx mantelli]|uniref:Placenta growth factor-like isoform X2 n=1 Tax=Apteryx mantelli TaxID=2696672 RepID=A0ABM4EJP3_9AVES